MKFVVSDNISHNDVQVMAQVFFHHIGFELVEDVPNDGLCLAVEKTDDGSVFAGLFRDCHMIHHAQSPPRVAGDTEAKPVALAIHQVLSAFTGYKPPWGLLTGIRPAKLITASLAKGLDKVHAVADMSARYLVEQSKALLCADVAEVQGRIMATSPQNAISIYIGIPFCPTICHYCSFSAYPVQRFKGRMDGYVQALVKEIHHLGQVSRGKFVENIYIGGGTPTALDDDNFQILLDAVARSFDVPNVVEYTVEAGRPDTITKSKLTMMKERGVTRISINPQTLKQDTLDKIGRGHTVGEFFDAYKLAQDAGFDHINIDLILGLTDETEKDVKHTIDGILTLAPKSVTVHTLAIKRASKLKEDLETFEKTDYTILEEMLTVTAQNMTKAELIPYYLYRQKNSPGNFENVGYAKAGYEGRYNIHMMEEVRSVYAAGCGAISKLVDTNSGRIDRIVNLRDLDQYIQRIDEIIARKELALGE
ncbi:MAG: coproporphyrinogen dehydrogenase HemZ [Defluviitaleaceae bacterium]|nr:coproporphyrinogen dehydrogenase HemZ [Defluviitaleaceae bacterium]